MAEVTVTQFAEVLKVPVEKLLTQLEEAGIKVGGPDDTISEDAKLRPGGAPALRLRAVHLSAQAR